MRRHEYADARSKRVDFWKGFVGWIIGNAIMSVPVHDLGASRPEWLLPLGAAVLVINVAALPILALTRRFAAFGALVAFATAFAMTVVLGVVWTAGDYVAAIPRGDPFNGVAIVVLGFFGAITAAIFALIAVHRRIQ